MLRLWRACYLTTLESGKEQVLRCLTSESPWSQILSPKSPRLCLVLLVFIDAHDLSTETKAIQSYSKLSYIYEVSVWVWFLLNGDQLWAIYMYWSRVLGRTLFYYLKPFTPRNEWCLFSPHNINTLSCTQVMRIRKDYHLGITVLTNHQILIDLWLEPQVGIEMEPNSHYCQ